MVTKLSTVLVQNKAISQDLVASVPMVRESDTVYRLLMYVIDKSRLIALVLICFVCYKLLPCSGSILLLSNLS